MHLVVDVLPLRVEAFEDLGQDVDRLLAAQASPLGLELLQQVLGGHGLPDQVATHRLLRQLNVTVERQDGEWDKTPRGGCVVEGGENKKKDRACGRGQRKEGERQNESVCELERVRVRKVNKQERLKRNIPGTGG